MPTSRTPAHVREDPVELARAAIWRLFEEGCIDDDMATTSLLAIDLGVRRVHQAGQPSNGVHRVKPTPRAA
ncbi:MAG TPA: hypothetical protein VKV73_02325 [Chloroflexota bacterium]|nr:hypothetical protein [Chloroflexota bacterium]